MTLRGRPNLLAHQMPVWIGMVSVVAISWLILGRMEADMMDMAAIDATRHAAQGQAGVVQALVAATIMWAIMMVAMMLPTIVPSAFLFSTLAMRRAPGTSKRTTVMYITGYAASWIGFAVPAAAVQLMLANAWLLDPMARSNSAPLSSAILLAAGLYQFSPLKRACLSKCRTPLGYFMINWRDGVRGALILGMRHGGYCIACCWTLMAVMFVVGAMSLAWMSVFTLVVLGEKIMPSKWQFDRVVGAVLVVLGLWLAGGW